MAFIFVQIFVLLVFWRPQEWLVRALYGWPLLDIFVGLALFAVMIDIKENRQRLFKSPLVLLYAGLFLAALMSHIAHTYFEGMIKTFEATWKISLFGILFFLSLDRSSRLRAVARIFVIMTCIMTIHALMQDRLGRGFAGQPPIFSYRPGSDGLVSRSLFFGIFEDPNDLAQILAASVPLAFVFTKKKNLFSILLGAAVVWFLIEGIATTESRGGQVGLLASLVFLSVLLFPDRWMLPIFGILVVAALALCPFSGPFLDSSAHDRVIFWGEANWVFKRNPIFGVGYNMFEEAINRGNAAHNAFVLCYTELGLFGYWFWFSALVLGFLGCWRTRLRLKDVADAEGKYVYRFAGVILASTGGFLASSYFLTRAYVYPHFFLVGLLNAVPFIAQDYLPLGSPSLLPTRKDLFVTATIASLASIVYIYLSIIFLNKAMFG